MPGRRPGGMPGWRLIPLERGPVAAQINPRSSQQCRSRCAPVGGELEAPESAALKRALWISLFFHMAAIIFISSPVEPVEEMRALAALEFGVYDPSGGEGGQAAAEREEPSPEKETEPEAGPKHPGLSRSSSSKADKDAASQRPPQAGEKFKAKAI